MAKTFSFPVWLEGTPEQQEAEARNQALKLASFTRAKLTEEERLIGRGALLEQTARGNLEQSKGKDKEARILAENQLADALAMQGKYAAAAEAHHDRHRRKHFRKIATAIEMSDDEKCNCKDSHSKVDEIDLTITPRIEKTRLFSPLHSQVVSLVVCQKCGHTNARPLRSRLLKHRDANSQSEMAKRPLLKDVQVLNAAD